MGKELEKIVTCIIESLCCTPDINTLLMNYVCARPQSLQSCLTLFDPMDCSPPGSSVHRILQARILEGVAMPSSRSPIDVGFAAGHMEADYTESMLPLAAQQ